MSIARDYGVLIEDEGIALRGLFIIDPKGVLRYVRRFLLLVPYFRSIFPLPSGVGRGIQSFFELTGYFFLLAFLNVEC